MAEMETTEDQGVKSTKEVLQKWTEYYINSEFGIGIQCTKCSKWREVYQYKDKSEVPAQWICSDWKIDEHRRGSCRIPSNLKEEDFASSQYSPGDLVLAKMPGYPWWPAMVEDCPDTQDFYLAYADSENEYHVNFFGDKPLRSWVKESGTKDFCKDISPEKKAKCKKSLQKAMEQAEEALKMTVKERLLNFSFAVRYKGRWGKIEQKEVNMPPTPNEIKKSTGCKPQLVCSKPDVTQDSPQTSEVTKKKNKSEAGTVTKQNSMEDSEFQPIGCQAENMKNSNNSGNQFANIGAPGGKEKQQSSSKRDKHSAKTRKQQFPKKPDDNPGCLQTAEVSKKKRNKSETRALTKTNTKDESELQPIGCKAKKMKNNNNPGNKNPDIGEPGDEEKQQSSANPDKQSAKSKKQCSPKKLCPGRKRKMQKRALIHKASAKNSTASNCQQPNGADQPETNEMVNLTKTLDLMCVSGSGEGSQSDKKHLSKESSEKADNVQTEKSPATDKSLLANDAERVFASSDEDEYISPEHGAYSEFIDTDFPPFIWARMIHSKPGTAIDNNGASCSKSGTDIDNIYASYLKSSTDIDNNVASHSNSGTDEDKNCATYSKSGTDEGNNCATYSKSGTDEDDNCAGYTKTGTLIDNNCASGSSTMVTYSENIGTVSENEPVSKDKDESMPSDDEPVLNIKIEPVHSDNERASNDDNESTSSGTEPFMDDESESTVLETWEPVIKKENETIVSENWEPVIKKENETIASENWEPVIKEENETNISDNGEPIIKEKNETNYSENEEPVIIYQYIKEDNESNFLDNLELVINEENDTSESGEPDNKEENEINFSDNGKPVIKEENDTNFSENGEPVNGEDNVTTVSDNDSVSDHENSPTLLRYDSNACVHYPQALYQPYSAPETPHVPKSEQSSNQCRRVKKTRKNADDIIIANDSKYMPYSFYRRRMNK